MSPADENDKNSKEREPSPGSANVVRLTDLDQTKQPRSILLRGRGELTEDELGNPGVRKMLINELDRLDERVADLEPYKDKFHELDKELALEKLRATHSAKKSKAFEIYTTGTLAVSSALLGASRQIFDPEYAVYGILGAAAFFLAALVARIVIR